MALLTRDDLWTIVELAGVCSLVGGVWARWGAPQAFMLLGALLLTASTARAWRLGAKPRTE